MAKISKITKGLTGLMNTVSSISGIAENVKDIVSESESAEEKVEATAVIETIDQMEQWITSLQTEASKPAAMVLQQQMNVLKYVESPTMSGMMVDNIIVCLYKALEVAENEEHKVVLRDSVAALLQSVLFMSEAKVQYEIKKNKEEAVEMIANAGNLFTESVTAIACVMIPGAQAAAMPAVKNVLSENKMGSAVSMFLTAKKRQDILDDKIMEHNEMLDNLFQTLDKYFDIIGPSIQIHGVLSRYRGQLVEHYRQTQYKELESYTETLAQQKESWFNGVQSVVNSSLGNSIRERLIKGVVGVVGVVANAAQKPETLDYNEVKHLRASLQSKYDAIQEKIDLAEEGIKAKENELQAAGLFQSSLKNSLRSDIAKLKEEITALKKEQIDIREKIRIVAEVLEPIEKKIEEYTAELDRITEKYAIC